MQTQSVFIITFGVEFGLVVESVIVWWESHVVAGGEVVMRVLEMQTAASDRSTILCHKERKQDQR